MFRLRSSRENTQDRLNNYFVWSSDAPYRAIGSIHISFRRTLHRLSCFFSFMGFMDLEFEVGNITIAFLSKNYWILAQETRNSESGRQIFCILKFSEVAAKPARIVRCVFRWSYRTSGPKHRTVGGSKGIPVLLRFLYFLGCVVMFLTLGSLSLIFKMLEGKIRTSFTDFSPSLFDTFSVPLFFFLLYSSQPLITA